MGAVSRAFAALQRRPRLVRALAVVATLIVIFQVPMSGACVEENMTPKSAVGDQVPLNA